MKLESTAKLDQIIEKWQNYMKCYDGNMSSIETFRLQVARLKNDERSENISTREGATPPPKVRRASRQKSSTSYANSSKPSRQGSASRGVARRGVNENVSLSNIDEEDRES